MKSVTICSSSRFAPAVRRFADELKKFGVTVFLPNFYRVSGGDWNRLNSFDKKFVAMGLTYEHFQKIRMGDVFFLYNEDGYAGISTNMEIGYAVACNKPIYALSDVDEDPCRQVLISSIVRS